MHIYCPAESLVRACNSNVSLSLLFMSAPLNDQCVLHLGSHIPQSHVTGGKDENSNNVYVILPGVNSTSSGPSVNKMLFVMAVCIYG